jgi:hypothetical protein
MHQHSKHRAADDALQAASHTCHTFVCDYTMHCKPDFAARVAWLSSGVGDLSIPK